jgi:PAS domain S-box-containing protein
MNAVKRSIILRYAFALVAVAAACLLRAALEHLAGTGLPTYITFYPAVMLVALLAGIGPGLLATAISVLVVDYWLLPPDGILKIGSLVDVAGIILFTCMGVFMSVVAGLYRRARRRLEALVAARTATLNQANAQLTQEITDRRTADENLRQTAAELAATNADLNASRAAALNLMQDSESARFLAEQAAAALRESEERLRLAYQAAKIGAFEWNVQTGVNVWMPELEAMYGLAPGEFGKTQPDWEQLVHPEDRAAAVGWVNRAFEMGEAVEGEWRVVWRDGSVHWIAGRFQVFEDADGKPLRLSGVNMDITERKQVEAALKESEARVRRKLESVLSPEGDLGVLELVDLIDSPALQKLMDEFYAVVRIPMAIIDIKGRVLVGVGWQDICTRFHRVHPDTCRLCVESDIYLSAGLAQGECRLYKCKNNLWDMATPIFVGDQHVGNVFTGQFFFDDEPVDREFFREQAKKYGFDEIEYLAALDRVPRLRRETVDRGMAFFLGLADTLSKLGYSNVNLARLLAERDRLTESLKQSESFYRQTLESIPGMVFTTRPDGYCDYQSQQWVDFTGIPMAEHLGDGWNKLLHPDDRPRAYAAWRSAVEERAPYDLEYRVRRRDGQYEWFKVRGEPIRDAAGKIVRWFGVAANIDAMKRTEAALEQARQAAESANVAKSQFLASMSHELRTPMNAILGMTDLALGEPLPPTVRDFLQTSKESADLLLKLLNEILDFSRIEAGRFELETLPFPLRKTVEQVVKTLAVRAKENRLELILSVAEDLPDRFLGDPLRLRQVLMNLVNNAIKFTLQGKVVVRVERVGQETTDLGPGIRDRILCSQMNDQSASFNLQSPIPESPSPQPLAPSPCLRFSVTDTGIGIPADKLEKIFAPFTQADSSTTRRFGGTGLGLAISQRLVNLMGGHIRVESQVDQGSTFYFTIPLAVSEEPVDEEESIADDPNLIRDLQASASSDDDPRMLSAPRRVLRVLLAEDTPANQKLVLHILKKRGHRVEIAESGLQAIERLAEEDFDAILMDVQMPDMDGFQATAKIRNLRDARKARLPIIAMTAHALKGDRERCLAAGMNHYLSKPLNAVELIEVVERLANNGNELPHSPARMDELGATAGLSSSAENTVGQANRGTLREMTNPQTPAPRPKTSDESSGMETSRLGKAQSPVHRSSPSDAGMPSSVFNLDEAMNKCFENYELFQEMAEFLWSESDAIVAQMRAALAAGAADDFANAAHRLKGTILYLGAAAALAATTRAEALGRAGDLTAAPSAIEILERELERLKEALHNHRLKGN